MPRLNVLGTFEEIENNYAYTTTPGSSHGHTYTTTPGSSHGHTYTKFKLHPRRRFRYLHITIEVINEMKTCFSSISISIKNYKVHHLLTISMLILTLTKFHGFRVLWVIKRHPMIKPSPVSDEWKRYKALHKDVQASTTRVKVPEELMERKNSNEMKLHQVQTNIDNTLMKIIEDIPVIDNEGKDSIYTEDELNPLGIINEEQVDMDIIEDFEASPDEEHSTDKLHSNEDSADIWLNIDSSDSGHENTLGQASSSNKPIGVHETQDDTKSKEENPFELKGIKHDEALDELSSHNYGLNPVQSSDDSNEIKQKQDKHFEASTSPSIKPTSIDNHHSLALANSHSSSSLIDSSTPRHNETESSTSEHKNEPYINLYIVLDSPYQMNMEKLNKIMEQPFQRINYSVDKFDQIHFINEIGIDENDYGLVSFID